MTSENSHHDLLNDGEGSITRRRFLEKSAKFLAYTSPTLTTLLVADRACATSVDPYFEVEALTAVQGSFAGMPATGTPNSPATREWEMLPVVDDFAVVSYQQYKISILGSGQNMPSGSVSVTVTWNLSTGSGLDTFRWGPGPAAGSSRTVDVPTAGGTLGVAGTVVNSGGQPWPDVEVGNEYTGTAGTVTFVANPPHTQIKQLTLNIVRR